MIHLIWNRLFFAAACCCLFSACATQAVIYSPNQIQNTPGTIYLSNGDSATGLLSLNNEVLFPKDIRVQQPDGNQQIHLMDVKGMQVGNNYFELKHHSNHWRPSSGFYFMERITPADFEIQVYRHLERKQKGKSLQQVVHEPVFYVQFPGEKQDRVWASNSKKLMPHFEKKMSRLLKDCPQLADTIRHKERGYFYNRLNATEAQRGQVLLRIAEAYHACR
ncbi:hypothetical protein [Paracnuella aquatica]|uniref:hypothetical protein n=1 Tax=Paracnuella aquatica TaxID=2268757 RepID=UPI000DEF87FA|nr:hypothetical protein [Paracnuella aquatica]RPD51312.1 hypothetical protein DRJ53_01115 [Paracnuella aquatica]